MYDNDPSASNNHEDELNDEVNSLSGNNNIISNYHRTSRSNSESIRNRSSS